MNLKTLTWIAAALALCAAERFDMKVREDFFAGFAGNREALERAMKAAERALAENPNHAEAMVWRGSALFFMAGEAFGKGDTKKGIDLSQRGVGEMAKAVSLEPETIGVLIPRGATYLTATRFMPKNENTIVLLKLGVADYQKAYDLQSRYLEKLGSHPRGELLFGLADGYARLGDTEKARLYFEKLAADGPASGHLEQAKTYLADGTIPVRATCVGCHVAK